MRDRLHLKFSLKLDSGLALYLATLFLGAGVFMLPLEAAAIGVVPLLLLLAVCGLASLYLYGLVADRLSRADGLSGSGDALGQAVAAAGAGRPGTLLSVVGMVIYCVGATYNYAALGGKALQRLADVGNQATLVATMTLVGGLLGLVLRTRTSRNKPVLRRLTFLASTWSIAVGVLVLIAPHVPAPLASAIALAGFTLGAILVADTSEDTVDSAPDDRDETDVPTRVEENSSGLQALQPSHRASVVALGMQFSLMALLALISGAVVVLGSGSVHWDVLLPADDVNLWSALVGPAGVVIFALVATGLLVINSYSQMSTTAFRRMVMKKSILLVLLVLALWMLLAALLTGHDGLTQLVKSGTNTALGMSSIDTHTYAVVGLLVVGAVATLLAVNGAAVGFNTGLSSELHGAAVALGLRRTSATAVAKKRLTWALIVFGATLAWLGSVFGDDDMLLAVLRVAGISGGGVLWLVLPLMCETRTRWRAMSAIGAMAAGIALTYASCFVTIHDDLPPAMTGACIAIAIIPAVLAVPAAIGVIRHCPQTVSAPSSDVGGEPVMTVTAEVASETSGNLNVDTMVEATTRRHLSDEPTMTYFTVPVTFTVTVPTVIMVPAATSAALPVSLKALTEVPITAPVSVSIPESFFDSVAAQTGAPAATPGAHRREAAHV